MLQIAQSSNEQIAVLTSKNNPYFPYIIKRLLDETLFKFHIIIDEAEFSPKNFSIWRNRTHNYFDNIQLPTHCPRIISIKYVSNHNDQQCIDYIDSLDSFILLNGGTPQKLSTDLINSSRYGCLNVHPGDIPKYRGSSCVEWAILDNQQIANTCHLMSAEYDAGKIISKEYYNFKKGDTYQDIRIKVYCEAISLLINTLNDSDLIHKLEKALVEPDVTDTNSIRKPINSSQMEAVIKKLAENDYDFLI